MADNKTKPTKLSVSAFINALTDLTRRADAKALVKLMQNANCPTRESLLRDGGSMNGGLGGRVTSRHCP